MIWRLLASIASQIHCLFALFCTKLAISSASTSRQLDHDVRVVGDRLDIEMIGQGFKAVDNKAQELLEFDSHGATNAAQRQAFQQQALDQNSCFLRDEVLLEALDKLTATVLALMVLLAIVNVTVFLELG